MRNIIIIAILMVVLLGGVFWAFAEEAKSSEKEKTVEKPAVKVEEKSEKTLEKDKAVPSEKSEALKDGKKKANKELVWHTDLEKAKAAAKKSKKPIFVEFLGSDWCPPCIMMEKEVYSKKEFKEYARKNLVLVKVDFPRTKELPEKQQEHNRKWAMEYKVEYLPTMVIVDAAGKELKRLGGYQPGGVEKFVEQIEKILKEQKKEAEKSKEAKESA